MRGVLSVSIALALSTTVAQAQQLPEVTCRDLAAAGAVTSCLASAYAQLDFELNTLYKGGFAIIDQAALPSHLSRDWKRAYQDTQRKWIAFREADCGPPIAYETSGEAGAAQISCKILRTRERLEELKRRYSRK